MISHTNNEMLNRFFPSSFPCLKITVDDILILHLSGYEGNTDLGVGSFRLPDESFSASSYTEDGQPHFVRFSSGKHIRVVIGFGLSNQITSLKGWERIDCTFYYCTIPVFFLQSDSDGNYSLSSTFILYR